MIFAERETRREHRQTTVSGRQGNPDQDRVDDLFSGLDACEREDASTQALPSRENVAKARTLAAAAFRLNRAGDPAVAALVDATAERLAFLIDEETICARRNEYWAETELDELVDLDALVNELGPTESYFKVMDAMNGPMSNASRVAEAMVDTPMLAGFALRLVNGPAYGLSSRVDSLPRAVAMAGFNEISGLTLAVHMARALGTGSLDHWRRAMTFGLFARHIARLAHLPGDWFFAAGLLADMGRLAASRAYPGASARASSLAARSLLAIHEAEEVVMGQPLSTMSARLIRSWDGAERLAEVVGDREQPASAGHDPVVCVLHLAEIMAQAACVECLGEVPVSRLDSHTLDVLGLSPRDLAADQSAILEQAGELARVFAT